MANRTSVFLPILQGRLPNAKEALSGFTLANSWIAISVYFGVGIVFALDTFVSQAYGASTNSATFLRHSSHNIPAISITSCVVCFFDAENYKLIGTVFQNCLVVVTIISIPTAVSYWFTEPMLLALKQGEEVSRLAGT
jgi:Na+-driven multidrug efflux pump